MIPLEEVTGFAEMLGHRVVTLHPAVHGGILARPDVPEDVADLAAHGIERIDLVCVNLYPFEQTVGRLDVEWDEAIEQIDIGGPALLRAAAKNHAHVIPICRPDDYEAVLRELREADDVSVETRRSLAARVFTRTAAYDSAVAGWMLRGEGFPETLVPAFDRALELSYGENPHQQAVYYAQRGARTHLLARVEQLHGKPLSFNNLNDLSAARLLALELDGPACVIVKHANPCGVGLGETIEEAYAKALAADPVSAYGGVVVLTRPVSATLGGTLAEQFVEVLFAPGYDAVAVEALVQKPGVRILNDMERRAFDPSEWDLKRVLGGVLVQERDGEPDPLDEMDVVCGEVAAAGWDDLLVRLDGGQAHALERDRDRPRRPDARRRRRADEPRRRGADRDREGSRARSLARGRGARLRCVLPVPGRPGARARGGHSRDHPARRLEARRRGGRRRA